MLESLHPTLDPAFVFYAVGLLAMMAPKNVRKIILSCGPVLGLLAFLNLELGMDFTYPFSMDYSFNYLYVDKLSWIFGFIFCIMGIIGGIYSCHNDKPIEALCSMCYVGCAIGAVLAKDWICFLFNWEVMAGTSLFLIWADKRPGSRGAGLRYLLVHMFGGNMLLYGIVLKLEQGQMFLTNLTQGPHDFAFYLIVLGVLINVAFIPFHAWLVDAYPSATITGGVFMSSYTTKVAVYALLRIFAGTDWLLWGGVVMAIYGACYAIMENDMYKLLSYHIISQVGFMVAGVGAGTAMSMDGATAHAFCDILFKSLLFMCCGGIIYATGVREINKLGGMAKKFPFVFVCFLIGAASISGIPLFNGFISKVVTITAIGHEGYEAAEICLELASIGTLMSIAYKMVYFIFLAPDKGIAKVERPIPTNMYVGMGLGALLCTIYGCFPQLLYQYLPYPMQYEPFTVSRVAQALELACFAVIPFIMYLPKMEPHTALSLDTDWFYRKPLPVVVNLCTDIGIALCDGLGRAWGIGIAKVMNIVSNPMDLLDARPHRPKKRYNPENYRTAIADPIMITLFVLFVSVCYCMRSLVLN